MMYSNTFNITLSIWDIGSLWLSRYFLPASKVHLNTSGCNFFQVSGMSDAARPAQLKFGFHFLWQSPSVSFNFHSFQFTVKEIKIQGCEEMHSWESLIVAGVLNFWSRYLRNLLNRFHFRWKYSLCSEGKTWRSISHFRHIKRGRLLSDLCYSLENVKNWEDGFLSLYENK